jgi:hypothetical protein
LSHQANPSCSFNPFLFLQSSQTHGLMNSTSLYQIQSSIIQTSLIQTQLLLSPLVTNKKFHLALV